jgi:hypothetical protein
LISGYCNQSSRSSKIKPKGYIFIHLNLKCLQQSSEWQIERSRALLCSSIVVCPWSYDNTSPNILFYWRFCLIYSALRKPNRALKSSPSAIAISGLWLASLYISGWSLSSYSARLLCGWA